MTSFLSRLSVRDKIAFATGVAYGLGALVTWLALRDRDRDQVVLRLGPFALVRRS